MRFEVRWIGLLIQAFLRLGVQHLQYPPEHHMPVKPKAHKPVEARVRFPKVAGILPKQNGERVRQIIALSEFH